MIPCIVLPRPRTLSDDLKISAQYPVASCFFTQYHSNLFARAARDNQHGILGCFPPLSPCLLLNPVVIMAQMLTFPIHRQRTRGYPRIRMGGFRSCAVTQHTILPTGGGITKNLFRLHAVTRFHRGRNARVPYCNGVSTVVEGCGGGSRLG